MLRETKTIKKLSLTSQVLEHPLEYTTYKENIFFSLEKVEKMAAFDIHLYGSKILEQFPSENR